MRPLAAIRRLLGQESSVHRDEGASDDKQPVMEPSGTERRDREQAYHDALQEPSRDDPLASDYAGGNFEVRSSHVARLMGSYLKARAEETLASLLEELSNELAARSGQALDSARQQISAEIASVREDVSSSRSEVSRMGRELIRWGATLDSVLASTAAIGPNMERLESSLRTELMRELARYRQLREESEQAALDDMLAALDGLEAGQQDGRELLQALASVQRRLGDATAQRWWRAMAEATGVKRRLPEIPVADVESWINGLELTYKRLQDALGRRGVTRIEAVGKPFDPYLHEAVAIESCSQEQDGIVLREQRKGYRTADRVVRLSQVVVGLGEPTMSNNKPRRRSTEQVEK